VAKRRTRLTKIGEVLVELGRVYRDAHDGRLPWAHAGVAAKILREIRFCIEGDELERRVEALESRVPPPGRSNGHDLYARH